MCATTAVTWQCPTSPGSPRAHQCQQQHWGEAARGCSSVGGKQGGGTRRKIRVPHSLPARGTALPCCPGRTLRWHLVPCTTQHLQLLSKTPPLSLLETLMPLLVNYKLLRALQGVYHRLRALLWGYCYSVLYLRYTAVRDGNQHEGKAQVVNICCFFPLAKCLQFPFPC